MLKEGSIAPDFSLMDQNGREHKLGESKGEWVLLYFYPKDDTPGCTKEACAFRDNFPHFDRLKVKIYGISADSVQSHLKFVSKYGLNFTLLADPKRDAIKAYEAAVGPLTKRVSYLINPNGAIFKAYANVKPVDHAEQVLNDLKAANLA